MWRLESRAARLAARGLDDLEAANQDIRKLGQAQARANGLCGDGCFVRGTLVDTRDGPRPIEEIRPGDVVTARDQLTGEVEERQVVQTFEHADSAVVEVTYVDAQGKVETLGATPDHPFHVDGVGWVEAGKLLPGQRVTGLDGDYLVVQHIALDDERHTTYNFEVGEFHTYFVGNGDAWVHNAGGVHRHHPIPKFLGGAEVQDYYFVDGEIHLRNFHTLLKAKLAEAGFPLTVGSRGGGINDWMDYFDMYPDEQARALNVVYDVGREIDEKHGTEFTKMFLQNINKKGTFCK